MIFQEISYPDRTLFLTKKAKAICLNKTEAQILIFKKRFLQKFTKTTGHQGETILNFFKNMKDPDPLMGAKSDSKTFL